MEKIQMKPNDLIQWSNLSRYLGYSRSHVRTNKHHNDRVRGLLNAVKQWMEDDEESHDPIIEKIPESPSVDEILATCPKCGAEYDVLKYDDCPKCNS